MKIIDPDSIARKTKTGLPESSLIEFAMDLLRLLIDPKQEDYVDLETAYPNIFKNRESLLKILKEKGIKVDENLNKVLLEIIHIQQDYYEDKGEFIIDFDKLIKILEK